MTTSEHREPTSNASGTRLQRGGLAARGLLVSVTLGVFGCGGCQAILEPHPAPARPPDAIASAHSPTAPRRQVAVDEVALPVLNDEALAARVAAQRELLGDSLFEGGDGRSQAWLSPQETAPLDAPSLDDALLNSLPGSSGLGGSDYHRSSTVNGNALGLFEPVDPGGAENPLVAFHRALRDLKSGRDPDGKVRVVVYGASHTDADVYPHYLRAYLQSRFGNGGHGFVHIAKPWRWYGHVDVEVEGFDHWTTEHAQRRDAREDGYFGLLGASLSAKSKRAFGRVTPRHGTAASRYELYFLGQPRGGSFKVTVDGEVAATVKTRAREFGPGYHAFELPEGTHTIEVSPVGNGEVRMFGMTLERDAPGVVVDTLGIGGTRAANMLAWDEAIWADNLRRRDPDLVVLAYGTNEAMDTNQPIGVYEADLREALARVERAVPGASCLLIGPGDFPVHEDGQVLPRPRLREVVDVQARVASEAGCGFWDTLAFMGGELSMAQWVAATPPMARDDHIHLTRRGYVRMGMALVDALMVAFDGDGAVRQPPLTGP